MSIEASESPISDCDRVLEIKVRQLSGEPVDEREQALLHTHLAACPACASAQNLITETDAVLKQTYGSAKVRTGFSARVLSALPASFEVPNTAEKVTEKEHARVRESAMTPVGQNSGLRVYSNATGNSQSVSRSWFKYGLAATVLIGVLGLVLARVSKQGPGSIKRGLLAGADGQAVSEMQPGHLYTAKEETVLDLGAQARVKAEAGAEIEITGSIKPEVRLRTGDLYAATTDDDKPLRVSCSNFDTDLHTGDFFIAEERGAANETHGVVIVFSGHARVTPKEMEEMPLTAGQVFYSVGDDVLALSERRDLTDLSRDGQMPAILPNKDVSLLRQEYKTQVEGYQKELKQLREELTRVKEEMQVAELRERSQRVVEYLDAHRRRLKSLSDVAPTPQFPLEQIERGLKGHLDPATWL